MEGKKKIKNFTDLDAWREAYKLALMIYEITKKFPKDETFGIVSQMRRCVVSIASNTAEGFSRKTAKDKTHYQLYISNGIGYISKSQLIDLVNQTRIVHKLVTRLI